MTDIQPKFKPFNPYLSVGDSQSCNPVKSIIRFHHQGDIAWHLASGITPDMNSSPMETALHIQDRMWEEYYCHSNHQAPNLLPVDLSLNYLDLLPTLLKFPSYSFAFVLGKK